MFDFWKEVIINSDKVEGLDRVQAVEAFESVPAKLRVLRCADYNVAGIVDGVIYKTEAKEGTPSQAEFTVDMTGVEVGAPVRLKIDLGLLGGRTYSDFAQPWSIFKKPLIVETAAVADSAAVAKALVKNLKAAQHEGNVVLKAVAEGAKVTLTVTDVYVTIKSVELAQGAPSACYEGCEQIEYVPCATDLAIVTGEAPFGTGEWIRENLRFPSDANLRYAAPNADETPIPGAKYVQYAFEYAAPNRGLHGQGTVGQTMTSLTHHVFYVLESLVEKIEPVFASVCVITTAIAPNTPVPFDTTEEADQE